MATIEFPENNSKACEIRNILNSSKGIYTKSDGIASSIHSRLTHAVNKIESHIFLQPKSYHDQSGSPNGSFR